MLNITKKRFHKIKKSKNQSKKRLAKRRKRKKRNKKSFRRGKRKSYNLKKKSLKNQKGGGYTIDYLEYDNALKAPGYTIVTGQQNDDGSIEEIESINALGTKMAGSRKGIITKLNKLENFTIIVHFHDSKLSNALNKAYKPFDNKDDGKPDASQLQWLYKKNGVKIIKYKDLWNASAGDSDKFEESVIDAVIESHNDLLEKIHVDNIKKAEYKIGSSLRLSHIFTSEDQLLINELLKDVAVMDALFDIDDSKFLPDANEKSLEKQLAILNTSISTFVPEKIDVTEILKNSHDTIIENKNATVKFATQPVLEQLWLTNLLKASSFKQGNFQEIVKRKKKFIVDLRTEKFTKKDGIAIKGGWSVARSDVHVLQTKFRITEPFAKIVSTKMIQQQGIVQKPQKGGAGKKSDDKKKIKPAAKPLSPVKKKKVVAKPLSPGKKNKISESKSSSVKKSDDKNKKAVAKPLSPGKNSKGKKTISSIEQLPSKEKAAILELKKRVDNLAVDNGMKPLPTLDVGDNVKKPKSLSEKVSALEQVTKDLVSKIDSTQKNQKAIKDAKKSAEKAKKMALDKKIASEAAAVVAAKKGLDQAEMKAKKIAAKIDPNKAKREKEDKIEAERQDKIDDELAKILAFAEIISIDKEKDQKDAKILADKLKASGKYNPDNKTGLTCSIVLSIYGIPENNWAKVQGKIKKDFDDFSAKAGGDDETFYLAAANTIKESLGIAIPQEEKQKIVKKLSKGASMGAQKILDKAEFPEEYADQEGPPPSYEESKLHDSPGSPLKKKGKMKNTRPTVYLEARLKLDKDGEPAAYQPDFTLEKFGFHKDAQEWLRAVNVNVQ